MADEIVIEVGGGDEPPAELETTEAVVADTGDDDGAVEAVVVDAAIDLAREQGAQEVEQEHQAEDLAALAAVVSEQSSILAALIERVDGIEAQSLAAEEVALDAYEEAEDAAEEVADVPSDEEPNEERIAPSTQAPHPLFRPWKR